MTILASSKLQSYAKTAKALGWLSLLFYSAETVVEFLSIVAEPKFQSAIIRGDWRVWVETPAYLGGIFFRGWIYWFLFGGLSLALSMLSNLFLDQYARRKDDHTNLPKYYQPESVVRISKWLERMAVIGAVANLFLSAPSLLQLKETVFSLHLPDNLSWGIWLGASASALLLGCGLLYLGLRGFAEVLRVMMEIEFNNHC